MEQKKVRVRLGEETKKPAKGEEKELRKSRKKNYSL